MTINRELAIRIFEHVKKSIEKSIEICDNSGLCTHITKTLNFLHLNNTYSTHTIIMMINDICRITIDEGSYYWFPEVDKNNMSSNDWYKPRLEAINLVLSCLRLNNSDEDQPENSEPNAFFNIF